MNEKIELRHYAVTKWIKLEGYEIEEMEHMVKQLQDTTQFEAFDYETGHLCLTFKDCIPKRQEEIEMSKKKNGETASHRIKLIKQIVNKKFPNVYFNLRRLTIKKLR